MTKTLNLPASTSTLLNTLLFVVTDPEMRWETAARAAELMALELRANQWWAEVGVVDGSEQEAEQLMKGTGPATTRIERGWVDYLTSQERDGKRLREGIEEACTVFLDALAEVGSRTAEAHSRTTEARGSWLERYRNWEPVTHTSPESAAIKAGLEALLAEVQGIFSDDHIDTVRQFIDDGHYLVALNNLAGMVANGGKLVFGKTRAEVMRLGALLGSDSPFVLGIMDVEEAPLPRNSVSTLTVPASSSALVNTLLFVVADPEMLWGTAARAADLIALDSRVDRWRNEVEKVCPSAHELHEAIRKTTLATTRVRHAWADYLTAPELDTKDVQDAIEDACQVFLDVLAEVSRGTAQ